MRVRVSQDGINCHDGKAGVDIRWSDVIAAWQTTEPKQSLFYIGTADHMVPIPLHLFSRDLAPTLESFLPRQSLLEDSYTRLPQHKSWCAKRKEIVENTATVLRIKVPLITAVGWVYLILFLPVTVLLVIFLSGPATWAAIVPGILSAVAAYLLLSSGPIEVNFDRVTRITPRGRYTMRWEEVEMVEADHQGQAIVLSGGGKCLPLPGPAWWSGKQKADVFEFFLAQFQERGITVHETGKALLRRCRNAEVLRGES